MAISVVETLDKHGRIDQDDLARRFAARYVADPARGYGGAMHQALSEIHQGGLWERIAGRLFDGSGSFGNGAAMRAPVLGAWFADDLDLVSFEARLSAEVTHAHPEGIAGAVAVAVAAAFACDDECPTGHAFIQTVLDHVPSSQVRVRTNHALDLDYGTPIGEAVRLLGNGGEVSAQDTVPLVLWCASQHLSDYEEALWLTVSALGDRDTTCAMVGGIVACSVGHDALPAEWLSHREELPK
jgi:ADP-ribosylglycohydrolase